MCAPFQALPGPARPCQAAPGRRAAVGTARLLIASLPPYAQRAAPRGRQREKNKKDEGRGEAREREGERGGYGTKESGKRERESDKQESEWVPSSPPLPLQASGTPSYPTLVLPKCNESVGVVLYYLAAFSFPHPSRKHERETQ